MKEKQDMRAVKLASRSYNDLDNLRDPSSCPPKKVRATGAGRKTKAPEVRQVLFAWFVDVRETLKRTSFFQDTCLS